MGVIYRLLFIGGMFLCVLKGSAQTVISGKVKDSDTKKGLDYATVSLYNINNDKPVDGTVTKTSGQYALAMVRPGIYVLKAAFLGYRQSLSDTIHIVAGTDVVKLPDLLLVRGAKDLETVTVVARQPIVENKIDKIVYNTANDVTAQGGVALDVLKKVPQVSVDADGNVELQGNSNIRFLINGKPSSIFGSSLTDALSSIPSSEIKSIEAVTSPGARYDAQGTGGIINIILKDTKMKGISGSVNLAGGTRLENGAFNINYRHNRFGLNAFVNGNAQLNSRSLNQQQRQSGIGSDTLSYLNQDGYTDMIRRGMQAGLGVDLSFAHNQSLNASIQYSDFYNNRKGITQQEAKETLANGQQLSAINSVRNSSSRLNNPALDWSLGYKKSFGVKERVLEFLYTASISDPRMESNQSQTYPGNAVPFNGNTVYNPGKDQQHYLSLDYTHPVSDALKLEAGVKGSFQKIESNNEQYVFDPAVQTYLFAPGLSYNLTYDLSVYAGYVSATMKAWNWLGIKAGLRTEYTHILLDYNNTHVPSYTTWVPSLILSHEFDNHQMVKAMYSRRLERPDYEELNPFLNISDPYNITTGNPYLKPEIGNNFELGYGKTYDSGVDFYVALSERINSNDIKPFTTFYPEYQVGDSSYTNVSVSTRRNIGHEYNSGLIITGAVPIHNFGLRTNIMLLHRHIVNQLPGAAAVTNAFSPRFNLNLNYNFPSSIVAELFGNYRGGFTNIQGKVPSLFTYTFAVRKQFWNKKAGIGLTATNFFDKYVNQVTTINTIAYTSYSLRSLPFRSFGITFNYKFGKLELNKKEKQDPDQNLPSEN
ncbi:MAG: TonB-dependent receptor [Niabella sp.]|nr:TonB-dependent receptor [Niabella sp.]